MLFESVLVTLLFMSLVACGYLIRNYFLLKKQHTALQAENIRLEERLNAAHDHHHIFEQHIKALCSESLEKASSQILKQSEAFLKTYHQATDGKLSQHTTSIGHLIQPIEQALNQMNTKIHTFEKDRASAYEGLSEKIKSLTTVQNNIHQQTGRLIHALQTPNVRGHWGEIQLKRLVEWAGMLPFCDFLDQEKLSTEERSARPDLIIRLPLDRHIVVDAKAPLEKTQSETEDPSQKAHEKNTFPHASKNTSPMLALKRHIYELSKRDYQKYMEKSPDFVILFLPTERLLINALEADASLLDYSAEKSVLLATPMTLIAMLKMIALGWHHESLNENTQIISRLSKELTASMTHMLTHVKDMGRALQSSAKTYNGLVETIGDHIIPHAQEIANLSPNPTTLNKGLKKLNTQKWSL